MSRTKTTKCSDCLCEIYPWDKMFLWDKEWLCEDCFDTKCSELSSEERADRMGVLHLTFEDLMLGG